MDNLPHKNLNLEFDSESKGLYQDDTADHNVVTSDSEND